MILDFGFFLLPALVCPSGNDIILTIQDPWAELFH